MPVFITVALAVWAALNGYAFWRLGPLALAAKIPSGFLWAAAFICWISLPASRWLRAAAPGISTGLDIFSTTWVGVVFLLCLCFLAVDLVTLGGWLLQGRLVALRGGAVAAALVLSIVGLVQGHRDPVIRRVEVRVPGLPASREGTRVLFVSDLHLGTQIGQSWIKRLVSRVHDLQPDLIAIGGDLVDHDADKVEGMMPELQALRAPLGVWAVLGNHDVYSGPDRSAGIMRQAGYHVLHDTSELAAPGLRVAGVDDLGVRGGGKVAGAAVGEALRDLRRGTEGCIFISHTPDGMELAAEAGAGLMLCGHTHGGQIWPFSYLVKLRFPTLAGQFRFGAMNLIVSRGAGTWGPRMRLWQPGEIWLVTLRAPKA